MAMWLQYLRRGERVVRAFFLDQRCAYALEFAMVFPVFLALLLMTFEISYDLYLQEVLNNSLQIVDRDIEIGSTEESASASAFYSTYVCPAATSGLLNCNNLFIRVEEMNFTSGTCENLDMYDATPAGAPLSGTTLELQDYWNAGEGAGSVANPSPCATTNTYGGTYPGFCNPGPQSMVLVSAVYIAPSFLGGLIAPVFYKSAFIRPIFATAAFVTEPFAPLVNPPLPC